MGGFCPGGFCPGRFCPRGILSREFCLGGGVVRGDFVLEPPLHHNLGLGLIHIGCKNGLTLRSLFVR